MNFLVAAILICTAAQSWLDSAPVYETEHWELHTDLPEDDVRHVAELLDTVYEAYRSGLSMLPKQRNERMVAWVFSKRADYIAAVGGRSGGDTGVVENSGGMFMNQGEGFQVLALWVESSWDRFEGVAKHEAFHQFAFSRFGNRLPPWVNEGIAEYFEKASYLNKQLVIGQVEANDLMRLQRALESGQILRFEDLMKMSQHEWNQNIKTATGAIQYTQSWAMIHFLVHAGDGGYAQGFDRFLLSMSEGMGHEEAFQRAFGGVDLVTFERAWAQYILQLKPGATKLAARRMAFLAEGIKELGRRERAVTSLADLQAGLQTISFAKEMRFGDSVVSFSANDPSLYTVPLDSLAQQQPVFVVRPGSPLPRIETNGLRPYDLSISWTRSGNDIEWSIEVGR